MCMSLPEILVTHGKTTATGLLQPPPPRDLGGWHHEFAGPTVTENEPAFPKQLINIMLVVVKRCPGKVSSFLISVKPLLHCLTELDEISSQHNNQISRGGLGGGAGGGGGGAETSFGNGQGQGLNIPVGGVRGLGEGMLNGVNNANGDVGAVPVGARQQQPPPPATPPPSSWASKVRAGLGSDSNPALVVAAGIGDMGPSGEIDPRVGNGIHGLSRGMGHLGQLTTSGVGGTGMGPVHGLDMEGGMPGESMQSPISVRGAVGGVNGGVGAVGMALGGVIRSHRDPNVQLAGADLGNGAQTGGLDVGVRDGSGGLVQDFVALAIGSGALGGSESVGRVEVQGFDACKDELLGNFPCVRLRGLAADTSVKDILDFFVGLGPVLDIVLEVRQLSCCYEIKLWVVLFAVHDAVISIGSRSK